MQRIVCSPRSKINYLTVNIYQRNPELWHFCEITVDSSTLLIKKSQGGGQSEPHSSRGVIDESYQQAKILHLVSHNVPDPKSLWAMWHLENLGVLLLREGFTLSWDGFEVSQPHESCDFVFVLSRTRHPCLTSFSSPVSASSLFFYHRGTTHTRTPTHTLPAGAQHVATHPVVLPGELEDGDLEVLGEPALGMRSARRFHQRCGKGERRQHVAQISS